MCEVGALDKWRSFGLAWDLHVAILREGVGPLMPPDLFDLLVEHGFLKLSFDPVRFFEGPVPEVNTVWSNLLDETEREVRRVFLGPRRCSREIDLP